jgi:hypothetical protein
MPITVTVEQAKTLARLAAEGGGSVTLHQLGPGAALYVSPADGRDPQVCVTPSGETEPIKERGQRVRPGAA